MTTEKDQLSYFEKKVMIALKTIGKATPDRIMKEGKFSHLVEVMNASSWLQMKGIVAMEERIEETVSLTRKSVGSKDLPERTGIKFLKKQKGTATMEDFNSGSGLPKALASIAIGWMRSKGWTEISKDGSDTNIILTEKGRKALSKKGVDEVLIGRLYNEGELDVEKVDKDALRMLSRRKDVIIKKERILRLIELTGKGKEIAKEGLVLKKQVGPLTPELLQSGKWGQVELRPYDIHAFAPTTYGGRRHPLARLKDQIRRIFLDMGFTEIWGNYVEPAFWNMDALFIPQDHPARDMQDTFYLKHPEKTEMPDEKLINDVKNVHKNGGGTGSKGWGGEWSLDMARKPLLRTHTTINTIRYLSKENKPPVKVFSIEPVFRKESIDKTHLPEFNQVEGIVVEKESSFRMLLGILREFYRRMGFEEIRMRPAYFPYTEPSMEVEVKFKDEWLELGGSGIFRPEVVAPFGIEEPVLAWGLGLERLAMLKYGLDDIRQLYISDLDWLKKMPMHTSSEV